MALQRNKVQQTNMAFIFCLASPRAFEGRERWTTVRRCAKRAKSYLATVQSRTDVSLLRDSQLLHLTVFRRTINLILRGGFTMRYLMLTTIAVTLIGCAAQLPTPEAMMSRHAANISAAEDAGYSVINSDKAQLLFCATRAPTGSHLFRPCLTETQWEQQQMWGWQARTRQRSRSQVGHPCPVPHPTVYSCWNKAG